jgi:hypothetical protein
VLSVVVIDVEGIRTFSAIGCIGVWIKFMRTSFTNVVYCFYPDDLILVVSRLRVAIFDFLGRPACILLVLEALLPRTPCTT